MGQCYKVIKSTGPTNSWIKNVALEISGFNASLDIITPHEKTLNRLRIMTGQTACHPEKRGTQRIEIRLAYLEQNPFEP